MLLIGPTHDTQDQALSQMQKLEYNHIHKQYTI